MGISEGGQRLVFFCESGKIFQHTQQFSAEITQAVPIKDQIPVVGHIAARGPQVDHTSGAGRRFSVGIDMCHHVMPHFLFPLRGTFKINIIDVRFQLRHLLCRNGQAKVMLRPGQRSPELSPDPNTLFLGEQMQHLFGSITGREGRFIFFVHHGHFSPFGFLSGKRCRIFLCRSCAMRPLTA